ncbi:MAG: Hemin uptake protein hemP [Nevskia sp.]|nr:Hemin uptake protein hemP [Nevskia sp.]
MSRPNTSSEVRSPRGDSVSDAAGRVQALPRLNSRKLFADARELLIEHGDELYRLRWTRSGKLILTK